MENTKLSSVKFILNTCTIALSESVNDMCLSFLDSGKC